MKHDWEFMEMPGKEHWYCHRCGGKSPTDPGHGGYCKPDWAWHEAQRYKAAGNTGRHEDSILWDRLRADLANLGAAYGALPEPQSPLTPWGEMLAAMRRGLLGPATSQRRDSDPVEIKAGEPISHPATRKGYTLCGETETNLFYDERLLAARKRRDREYGSLIYDPMSDNGHEWSWNTEACAHCGLTSTDIVEHGDVKCDGGKARAKSLSLSNAFASPPSFPKRIGWKPGDCE